jgi:nucleotidyltransferase/DNA polymerase involved in DNA repair
MRLACVTVPNFRIALERARRPELAGRPIAVGEPPPGTNTVVDCSPEAGALGVRTGMPLRNARTVAPELVVLPPDPAHYDRSFEALLAAVEEAEPLVEPGDAGTVFAAVDPHAGLEGEQRAGECLLAAVRAVGVDASAGIGEGKHVAWVAATIGAPGDVTVVPEGAGQAFLAPLSTLFLPVSYEAQRKFSMYGLHTIGEVARLEIGPVQAQFGAEGRRIHELARGVDRDPFVPRARTEPVAATLALPAPTVNSAPLVIAARQLAGRLLRRQDMRYRMVRQLRLRLSLLNGGSWERTTTLREPVGDEDGLNFVLRKMIEQLQLAGPAEEMTLEFIGLTAETGKQRSLLFAEQARRRAQLVAALRQLKTRFGGEAQVSRVVEVEPWSRIPERRYALIDYDL